MCDVSSLAYFCSSNTDLVFRFLIKDNETDLYREVDTDYAREKVSHALRSRLSSAKSKKRSRTMKNNGDSSPARNTQRHKTRRACGHNGGWSNEEEAQIQSLIHEQQVLLQTLLKS